MSHPTKAYLLAQGFTRKQLEVAYVNASTDLEFLDRLMSSCGDENGEVEHPCCAAYIRYQEVENQLIEDEDGAPLPAELQCDGDVYAALKRAINRALFSPGMTGFSADSLAGTLAVELAPVLWPWLPSNDERI